MYIHIYIYIYYKERERERERERDALYMCIFTHIHIHMRLFLDRLVGPLPRALGSANQESALVVIVRKHTNSNDNSNLLFNSRPSGHLNFDIVRTHMQNMCFFCDLRRSV